MNKIREINRVLDAYGKVRQRDKKRSRGWYMRALKWCKQVSAETKQPLNNVVGVVAAMSPGVQWSVNQRDAYAMCAGDTAHTPATYPNNVKKALHILGAWNEVEVLRRLKPRVASGMKVYAFYMNIRYPLTIGSVTIDRHAISVCLGRPLTKKEGSLTPLQYADYESVYRYAADMVGLKPQQLQAIVWEWWRKHGKAVAEEGHEY